ncbi:hypothetical protein Poly30_50160 [Planctomycetes bacterium Poly30]|uniref:Uncharacterized protein n=1 Tax=Saltatorellus ferox TaxID=2528018 RepID=A0A518EZF9_9BACT|nr:hypothetical protein Poly30_50160 [Planctomycetes bacterium Poly30]
MFTLLLLVPGLVSPSPSAQRLEVIYTDVDASPLSAVPGLPGAKFSSFARPALSPNGANWAITAETDLPATQSQVLIVNGAVVLREGDSPAYIDPLHRVNPIDRGININDAGQYAFTHSTDEAASENEYVVRGEASGSFTVISREGFQVTGAPMGWIAGFMNTSVITASGDVWYETDGVIGTPSGSFADNNLVMAGTTVFAQNGVSVPASQISGRADAWESFDFEDLHVSEEGLRYIVQGSLSTVPTEDGVVVVNGSVAIQEGYPLPGGPADLVDDGGIFGVYMHPKGSWMADGRFQGNNLDWVVLDGSVVALEGQPIHEGTTESYGFSSFFANVCDGAGRFVIGGITDAADTSRNAVVVYNGERVLVREGDPVDLDGNGLYDDDLFFHDFGSDDFRLTDDGRLYFVATLRTSTGSTSVGSVFVVLDIQGGVGSSFCAARPNSTQGASSISGTGSSMAASNQLTLAVGGLPAGVMGYFVTSTQANLVQMPGGSAGDLCIASFDMGRYAQSVQTSSSSGTVTQALDLTMTPSPSGGVAVLSGETRYWQFWHRDVNGAGASVSNFSNALCVTFD